MYLHLRMFSTTLLDLSSDFKDLKWCLSIGSIYGEWTIIYYNAYFLKMNNTIWLCREYVWNIFEQNVLRKRLYEIEINHFEL